jgi:hypothetical protein
MKHLDEKLAVDENASALLRIMGSVGFPAMTSRSDY